MPPTAKTGLILDDLFLRHRPHAGHPERPERLIAIRHALARRHLTERCERLVPQPVDDRLMRNVHAASYLDRLRVACDKGWRYIDCPDSAIGEESFQVARFAAGSVVAAVDRVMAGEWHNAFCAVRPPGHHAEHDRSMGFCLLNNVALAARHLLDAHGLSRVFIFDWDVHHGNGTQHLFEEEPRVFYASFHGDPRFLYPGTGFESERGRGAGEGTTLNVPFPPGADDAAYRRAFEQKLIPALQEYKPDFILISAGFDAHRLDPLAPIELETESFEWLTRRMMELADEFCAGRLVSVLEGGYHLEALGESAALHVEALLG